MPGSGSAPGRRRSAPPAGQGSLFSPAIELGPSPGAAARNALAGARKRALWFALVCLAWSLAIFVRLVDMQVVRKSFFEARARQQQEHTVALLAGRGLILDRRGRELAMSVPVDSICAMPAEVSDPEAVGDILSRILGLPRAELVRKLSARHGFCWIQRLAEPELAERVRALNLRGIYFQKESKRYYPNGSIAAHLIGAVGLDQSGLAGLEQAREEELQGRPGVMVIEADARQRQFAGTLQQAPETGENIQLTIDEQIQYLAERELATAIEHTNAAAGTIIALEPTTGELLAVASYPSFNPNEPVKSAFDLEKRRDFAVSSSFEPGSTFKLITISAALEEKVTRPDEVLDCQMGSIVLAGHRIHDHKPFGLLTVEQVLAKSSDVCTIKLGLRLGDQRMYQYIRRFGFGRPTGVELPGEAMGLTKPAERWSKISMGAISMGQEIGITGMQLVQAVGTIANNGVLVPPRLIEATFESGRKPAPAAHPPGRRVISPETAIAMKHMMEQVILNGTGRMARLDGYTAGGKTGTAQKIDPKTHAYSKSNYVASFVGMAPLNNPAVVIAVILDSPRGPHMGGSVSAPVFARVASEVLRYMQVPQEEPPDPALRRRNQQPDAALLAEVDDFSADGGLPASSSDAGALEPAPLPGKSLRQPNLPRFAPPLSAAVSRSTAPARVMLAVAEGEMPNFYGHPLRDVAAKAASLGLAVDFRGSGVARRQSPPPGSPVYDGMTVMVEFER